MSSEFLKLRKQILEDEFSNLNPEQREAVFSWDMPLLILAGAGSGKTTVIVNKIGYIMKYGFAYTSEDTPADLKQEDIAFLKECLSDKSKREGERYFSLMAVAPVHPYNILAITFTNKAAGEMRSRIEDKYNVDAKDLWALTFHSTCMRLLRRYIDVFGYSNNFSIYDESDSLKLIETIIKKLGLNEKYSTRLVKGVISKAKGKYLSPAQFADEFDDRMYSHIPIIYDTYQQELKEANALDFDDLIFLTVKLLEDHPEISKKVNSRFKYILVDEYQDTNPLQYRLVSLLAKEAMLCVVGDDDQSIYRFTGASVENILNFEDDFEKAQVIRLEQNYRSTQVILDAANAVIANNHGRKGKNLWTAMEGGKIIKFHHLPTQQDESGIIVKTIMDEMSEEGKQYNDFCVLYRTNAQSNNIEIALKGNGIPYRIFGGLAFFKRKEIQDMLAYLNVINNPHDMTRLRRIINEPKRGIGDTTIEKALTISREKDIRFYDVLMHAGDFPELSRPAEKLMGFVNLIEHFREKVDKIPVSQLFEELYSAVGYDNMLKTTFSSSDYQSRVENIMELLSSIKQFEKDAEDPTLIGYLEQTALVSAVDNLEESDNAVVLMTMHCAKGLEFDTVFITGFEEGLFPSAQSVGEEDGLEEERRLCYVAITRAKNELHLLCTYSRMLYGTVRPAMPSRFLEEIPKELVEIASKPMPTPKMMQDLKPKKISHIINDAVTVIPPKKSDMVQHEVGQKVQHKIFGEGVIISVVQMSSDSLIEVKFAKVGSKKLMSNFAKLKVLD